MRSTRLAQIALVLTALPLAAAEPPCGMLVVKDGGDLMVPTPVQEIVPLGRPVSWGPPSGATITWADGQGKPTGDPVPLGPTIVFDASGLTPEEERYVRMEFIRRQNGGGRTSITRKDLVTKQSRTLWSIKPIEAREYQRWCQEGCPPGRFEIDQQSIDRTEARYGSGGSTVTPQAAAAKQRMRFGTLDANGNLTPAPPPERAVKTRRSAISAGP